MLTTDIDGHPLLQHVLRIFHVDSGLAHSVKIRTPPRRVPLIRSAGLRELALFPGYWSPSDPIK